MLFRWVIGVWLIYCIVISSSYAGNLMAFMTTPSLTSPINTLRQVCLVIHNVFHFILGVKVS